AAGCEPANCRNRGGGAAEPAAALWRFHTVDAIHFGGGGDADSQIVEESVAEAVYQAVDGEGAAGGPGVLHDRGMTDGANLGQNVEFAKTVGTLFERRDLSQFVLVAIVHIFDVAEPVIDQAELGVA